MARWREAARYSVVDLSTSDKHLGLVQPGFYWFVPLDGDQAPAGLPEDHTVSLVGPYGSREAARDAALAWLRELLAAPSPDNDNLLKDAA